MAPSGRRQRHLLALVERVTFKGRKGKRTVRARVDTGAVRTSIDLDLARAIGVRPLKKRIRVRSATRRTTEVRKLARVTVRVGGRSFKVRASLADRSRMRYPAVVGRDVLTEGDFRVGARRRIKTTRPPP